MDSIKKERPEYLLEKLELREDSVSIVPTGRKISGGLALRDGFIIKSFISVPTEIEVGDQVVVSRFKDYIKTSPVREIISQSDEECVFETRTSKYKLTKIKDEDHEKTR